MKNRVLSIAVAMIVIAAFSFTAIAGGTHATLAMSSAKAISVTQQEGQSVSQKQDSTGTAVTKEAAPVKKEAAAKNKTNPKKVTSKGSKHSKKQSLKSKKAMKNTEETAKPPEPK